MLVSLAPKETIDDSLITETSLVTLMTIPDDLDVEGRPCTCDLEPCKSKEDTLVPELQEMED